MNILERSVEAVRDGARYRIVLCGAKSSFYLNGKPIITDGKLPDDADIESVFTTDGGVTVDVMEQVKDYHFLYKFSIPSERSDKSERGGVPYFRALPANELDDEDLMLGEPRMPMRCQLELFLLLAIVTGRFDWNKIVGENRCFWQSDEDKELVIYRSWVTGA